MWQLLGESLNSRLFLGTAQYPSPQVLSDAVTASGADVITVSLRRQMQNSTDNGFWQQLKTLNKKILPNTAGCTSAKEAITTAQMARELFGNHWIKLEVVGDQYTLQPDPFELLTACRELIQQGFEVFPYCNDDLILCQRLVDAGCKVIMPWGAPIGSGRGLVNERALTLLRQRLPDAILVVDAGLGAPSHAARALELGYDAVLLNTAVANAGDPVAMAQAFKLATQAGRLAFMAGQMAQREMAVASTPVIGQPFWHQATVAAK